MGIKLKNNVVGFLSTAISASDVGIALQSGNGANFPTLGVGDYFYATLFSIDGTYEIVKATARVGDSITVVRAQEGTTANSFAAGSRLELRVTAQSVIEALADSSSTVVTFTNKTINLANNTLVGTLAEFNAACSNADFASLAGIEILTNKTFSLGTNTLTGTLAQFNAACSDADFVSLTGVGTLTNKTLSLGANTLTGTLAQFNTACSDADFVSLTGAETLTNKTFNLTNNTLAGTLAQFNTACSDADFVSLAGAETLTNKTLTSPTINGGTSSSRAQASSETTGTLTVASANKTIQATGNITVPANVFNTGDIVLVYAGSSARTLTEGSGLTMRLAATSTTGNRTLAARGIAILFFVSTTEVAVGGTGVT